MEDNSRRRGMLLALGMTLALFAVQAALMGGWLSHISGAGQALALSALFALGFVLSTALEYGAGALLERRFGRRWWDYSMFSLNLSIPS